MKNNWIIAVLVPILSFVLPAFAHVPSEIGQGLLTVSGYVGLITLLTALIKPYLKDVWGWFKDFKYNGEGLSLLLAFALGFGAYFASYGIFEGSTWYWTAGMAFLGWLASNGWYDKILKP